MSKRRVTITVDPRFLADVQMAVGEEGSVSSWISQAVADRLEKERRLDVLGELIARYEAEHGEITLDEIEITEERDRDRAGVLRR